MVMVRLAPSIVITVASIALASGIRRFAGGFFLVGAARLG